LKIKRNQEWKTFLIKLFAIWTDSSKKYVIIESRSLSASSFLLGKEVKRLKRLLDELIKECLSKRNPPESQHDDHELDLDETTVDYLYHRIVDRMVMRMFDNLAENEHLMREFRELTKIQKMVILFNFMMDFDPEETANIIGVSMNSVYLHKSKALLRFYEELQHLF